MRNRSNKPAQSMFMQSAHGVANTLAVVTTFFGAPYLYNHTVRFVLQFSAHNYGAALNDVVAFAYYCACIALVFFTARMSLSTAIVMGAMTIAVRAF